MFILCVKELRSRHGGSLMASPGSLYKVDKDGYFKREPEPKTVPVRCLDDVEFKNLLGMNQFVRGE